MVSSFNKPQDKNSILSFVLVKIYIKCVGLWLWKYSACIDIGSRRRFIFKCEKDVFFLPFTARISFQ